MKTNTNSMIFSLKILSLLAFSLLITPTQALAIPGYIVIDNPTPYIISISPNSTNGNVKNSIVVTVTGEGFIPSSVGRVNGSDRATTFIDYSHLLIRLNPSDLYNANEIYLNVFNGFPGGGYSNSESFIINRSTPVTSTNNNYVNTNQTSNTINSDYDSDDNVNNNASNLAATAVFGSPDSFLPSGLIQWVFLAIIILLIVIFVRRIFGARKKYFECPLKHA